MDALEREVTNDFGIQQLLFHVGVQKGMMMGFEKGEWAAFYDKLNRTMPPYQKLPLFDQSPGETEHIAATPVKRLRGGSGD